MQQEQINVYIWSGVFVVAVLLSLMSVLLHWRKRKENDDIAEHISQIKRELRGLFFGLQLGILASIIALLVLALIRFKKPWLWLFTKTPIALFVVIVLSVLVPWALVPSPISIEEGTKDVPKQIANMIWFLKMSCMITISITFLTSYLLYPRPQENK